MSVSVPSEGAVQATGKRRSLLSLLDVPTEFGVLLLTLTLILTLAPYLGGTDLGIFKIPEFTPRVDGLLLYLGPLTFAMTVAGFAPLLPPKRAGSLAQVEAGPRSIPTDSKYRLQSISDIVRAEMAKAGFRIDGIQIGDRLHVTDLERMCQGAWYPGRDVRASLHRARAVAFGRKYAEPREDEKLVDPSSIKVEGLRPWESYLSEVLEELGISDLNEVDILAVGIGNGHADHAILKNVHSFRGVDISEEALAFAKKKFPDQMTSSVCEAEDLSPIETASVDLYLSLRTFQSTLFDRRSALHEAYRVMRNGGVIVLSIPTMFLAGEGEVLKGLIPPGKSDPNMDYARELAGRVATYLRILNFHDVGMDDRSPFEIFVHARR